MFNRKFDLLSLPFRSTCCSTGSELIIRWPFKKRHLHLVYGSSWNEIYRDLHPRSVSLLCYVTFSIYQPSFAFRKFSKILVLHLVTANHVGKLTLLAALLSSLPTSQEIENYQETSLIKIYLGVSSYLYNKFIVFIFIFSKPAMCSIMQESLGHIFKVVLIQKERKKNLNTFSNLIALTWINTRFTEPVNLTGELLQLYDINTFNPVVSTSVDIPCDSRIWK